MTSHKGTIALKQQDFDQNTLELGEDEASFNISSAQHDNGLEGSPGSRTKEVVCSGDWHGLILSISFSNTKFVVF